ncbi:MAG: hypothetical protein ACYSTL_00035 [Planctomycetota bacterium]|jgi:hypothetical protein
MKLGKRHKLWIAVLVLALGALIVDRALLGTGGSSPEKAIAAPVGTLVKPPVESPPQLPNVSSEVPREVPAKQTVTEKLEGVGTSRQFDPAVVRKGFCLSEDWLAEYRSRAPGESHLTPAQRFTRSHELAAVMVSGNSARAVIDDKCLRVGEMLDGFKLVWINEDSVIFEVGTEHVVLKLKSLTR